MIDILHVCPANCATGGPEAIHAFVNELNALDDVTARVWYWDIRSADPCPEEYKPYHCEYVTELPADFHGVLIVPEIWANRVMDYHNCTRAIYWLGVDAYAGWTPHKEQGAFLCDDSIIHIVQSEYAYDTLTKLGVRHIVRHTDCVNAEFYEQYVEEERSDIVLYNPAKATPFMHKIMAECSDITFKPIAGMTRRQVIDTMRHSKLYVDFGEFPGRERMPREAALCGCCIITSKIGAAGYQQDFLHPYKFESKESHLWAIANRIRYVLGHYEECRRHFDPLRDQLTQDITIISEQCKEVAEVFREVQYHHSGA